ncbi:MAG: hypothetical protein HOJ35_02680 [Bdellovibrionales bacterium]|nr:hypothetical protein [Bdellovibrionales bacterium]
MENKETDSTNTTSDPNTTSIQTWQNLLDRFFPKAIANESSSNMVMEIDRKFPCFNYRQGKCRSIEKEMKSVYPIHKNILNKKFYSLVKTTARIGDGLSNSHGISPKVASFMQQLNAQQPYITALNTKLEKKANQMQKKMNIRRINFEKQQKSFLEKVRQVALDSIKKAGAKLEDIVKFKPKSTIKPSKKIGDYGHESLEENITEIKSSGTQNSKVVNSIQNENNFNLKDVTVTKDKELSIFRIISRRYNLHFSQY